MTNNQARNKLRSGFTDFLSLAYVPKETKRLVEHSLGVKTNPKVMQKALAATQEKVRRIMDKLPHFNSQAFGLSVPGPGLFELILLGEYAWRHALAGEKAAHRYLGRPEESPDQTLALCLSAMGFSRPGQLQPFKAYMARNIEDGAELWRKMVQCLEERSRED